MKDEPTRGTGNRFFGSSVVSVVCLSILALFLRSYFVPFPFTYRILLSHEIDGVRKEKERLTASMFAGYSPRSCGSCFAHSLGSYPSHEVK